MPWILFVCNVIISLAIALSFEQVNFLQNYLNSSFCDYDSYDLYYDFKYNCYYDSDSVKNEKIININLNLTSDIFKYKYHLLKKYMHFVNNNLIKGNDTILEYTLYIKKTCYNVEKNIKTYVKINKNFKTYPDEIFNVKLSISKFQIYCLDKDKDKDKDKYKDIINLVNFFVTLFSILTILILVTMLMFSMFIDYLTLLIEKI